MSTWNSLSLAVSISMRWVPYIFHITSWKYDVRCRYELGGGLVSLFERGGLTNAGTDADDGVEEDKITINQGKTKTSSTLPSFLLMYAQIGAHNNSI